jgi:hypothetical protein
MFGSSVIDRVVEATVGWCVAFGKNLDSRVTLSGAPQPLHAFCAPTRWNTTVAHLFTWNAVPRAAHTASRRPDASVGPSVRCVLFFERAAHCITRSSILQHVRRGPRRLDLLQRSPPPLPRRPPRRPVAARRSQTPSRSLAALAAQEPAPTGRACAVAIAGPSDGRRARR